MSPLAIIDEQARLSTHHSYQQPCQVSNATAPETRLPGDIAMWFVIMMELTVFALFFIGFAVMKRLEPQMFAQGQEIIHISIGLACTISLLISSYFVALALDAAKCGDNPKVGKHIIASLCFAFIYLIAKSYEYSLLVNAGFSLSTNDFFTLYFLITAFHFMHVVLGCGILFYLYKQSRKHFYSTNENQGFEAAATYWHMVDLVWILVFFLIYIAH
ncbi:cytochrome c oxidase subunit 3 family protein [Shewanella subflava]|uniref:Cytochrome c oxidase subunit 3 family protein n=1 Tax=Shewanella subflava TaxID=2986476 RepID=A0ABT3ICW6_9GAMM|nr:cytochrome c oxidase subunit 3 family protein [Shewanella subflava]MCW3173897.1 cytochrome c oxidase subunit 3 family protein [Shewanella subflava]